MKKYIARTEYRSSVFSNEWHEGRLITIFARNKMSAENKLDKMVRSKNFPKSYFDYNKIYDLEEA